MNSLKYMSNSLERFYFILICLVGIIELFLMIIGVVQIKFQIEFLHGVQNINFLMLLVFLVIVLLVFKYAMLIHQEDQGNERIDKGQDCKGLAAQLEGTYKSNASRALNPAVANYLRSKIQELLGASIDHEAQVIKISLIQKDGQEIMTMENINRNDPNNEMQHLFYLSVPSETGERSGSTIPVLMKFIEQNVGQVQIVIDKDFRQSQ
ncbi:hypothetical protein [uncultured Brevibacillus sp.]|uniref:hypothetical protein n=1 Tax=uncultured Brevibacillus sp. TaxID=169970 RepID=UPI002591AAB5|nr:hypothetical protein [uncultured Brevibacillus sp.]